MHSRLITFVRLWTRKMQFVAWTAAENLHYPSMLTTMTFASFGMPMEGLTPLSRRTWMNWLRVLLLLLLLVLVRVRGPGPVREQK